MFKPLTDAIDTLARRFPRQILELESLLDRRTNVYLDYANLKNWASRLNWQVDMLKLKQLLQCFDTVNEVKVYYGTICGNVGSEKRILKFQKMGYTVITKPVKIIRLSIDVSSLSTNTATDILKSFISPQLLRQLKIESIEYLNERLRELNKQGITYIEHMKCNFDVEIGVDMLLDHHLKMIDGFSLWSGDSDFADPLGQLLSAGRRVTLFATARKVASELNGLRQQGLAIYEIKKIRDFIEE